MRSRYWELTGNITKQTYWVSISKHIEESSTWGEHHNSPEYAFLNPDANTVMCVPIDLNFLERSLPEMVKLHDLGRQVTLRRIFGTQREEKTDSFIRLFSKSDILIMPPGNCWALQPSSNPTVQRPLLSAVVLLDSYQCSKDTWPVFNINES